MKISNIFPAIDTNTGGEPTRTILGGIPHIPGETMSEKMLYMEKNKDWIRKMLMLEPRGNEVMSGAYLTPPCSEGADIGVIYIEVGCYLPMCGHDTIGVTTALIESGIIEAKEPYTYINLDTPAGVVKVKAEVEDYQVKDVYFENVPSFVFAQDVEVDVPELGKVTLDISYGGNFFAIVKAADVGLQVNPESAKEIVRKGNLIKDAVNAQVEVYHPENEFMNEVTHVEFSDVPSVEGADKRNAVVIIPGSIDRSPCGTGTSAKLASLYAKGQIDIDETFVHESIISSTFKCRVKETTKVGEFDAIIPEIGGNAFVTGINTYTIDRNDPIKYGFRID
jgi:proline racemase